MLYLYFNHSAFKNLHMEEIFHVGREALKDQKQFWGGLDRSSEKQTG